MPRPDKGHLIKFYILNIGYFLTILSIFCTLALIGNVLVLRTHFTEIEISKEMPKWVTKQAGIKFFGLSNMHTVI